MFTLFRWTKKKREEVRLDGSRVFLRPLQIADADDMYLFASDPEVTRYLPWEPNTTTNAIRGFLMEQVARRQNGHSIGFAIVHRETEQMIGSTDLMDLKVVPGQAELGYLLSRNYWNQGIMSEATCLTAKYGFEVLHLNRIIGWADQSNEASRRVMEKLGMRPALTEWRTVKGERRPYICYDIERAFWQQNSPLPNPPP